MVRVGSPEAGETPCHPIPAKTENVANPFRCTACGGENVCGFLKQSPPPPPLVRRLVELAFPSHSDGPTPTNRASARDANAHIGVIEMAVRRGGVRLRSRYKILGRGRNCELRISERL